MKRPRRRTTILIVIWVALVVASNLAQRRQPPPRRHPGDREAMLPRQAASGPVEGDHVRIRYRDEGAGETIVLLHGSPGRLEHFDLVSRTLDDELRVIRIDLPGFGDSERRVPDYGIRAHGRYVIDLLEVLGVERCHLLGFSMGSGVALQVADLDPARVASIIMYGGIGVMEGEGSGDYHFEQSKYRVGQVALTVLPELVPHFGLLGTRDDRRGFIRNFIDTDQRPLRGMLSNLEAPLLILHGRHDPLVPAWAAREHHRIVGHSELVMFEASHFMVFAPDRARLLTDEILFFVDRHSPPGAVPQRRTIDPMGPGPDVRVKRDVNAWRHAALIMTAGAVLDGPVCVAMGLFAGRLELDLFLAIFGCLLGTLVGDAARYAAGVRFGRALLDRRLIASRVPVPLDELSDLLDRRGWRAVLLCRFMPGHRSAILIAAGTVGYAPWKMAIRSIGATIVRTPLLVAGVALFGETIHVPWRSASGDLTALFISVAAILLLLHVMAMMITRAGDALSLLTGRPRDRMVPMSDPVAADDNPEMRTPDEISNADRTRERLRDPDRAP